MRSAPTYWFGRSMSHEAGRGEPASARAAVPQRNPAHRLHPARDPDADRVRRDQPGHQVGGLLRRTALGVERQAAGRIRQPGVQPGGPGDVVGLLARLRHAAAGHLLHGGRREPRAVEQGRLDAAQELGRVQARQRAAALADRGPRPPRRSPQCPWLASGIRGLIKTRTRFTYRPREAAVAVPDIPPGFDFTDPEIYTTRVPAEELAELRRAAPVWWVAQRRGSAGFDDEGYWAVTRHADIIDDLQDARRLLVLGEHRADPLSPRACPASRSRCSGSSCSTSTRPSTPSCAASSPAALPPGPSATCARPSPTAPSASWRRRSNPAPATSSRTSRPSCRCRRSANCSASRRRTGARSSPGRTG